MKVTLFTTLVLVASFAQANSDFPTTLNQVQYDRVFPMSVKYCAVTAVHRKGEGAGGPFGHAVLYFKNACIDKNFSYPQIRKCDETDAGQVQGVGVSVNKVFKNSNWVALPGQDLFFYGNLKDTEVLDAAAKEALISKVAPMGIYQGIILKDDVAKKRQADIDETRFKIDQSLDTDFAINFGRDAYCVNVPLTDALLDKGIEFVNLANMTHADPERLKTYKLVSLKAKDLEGINIIDKKAQLLGLAKEYKWDGISENCAHLAYNLFSAMGLVPPKKVRTNFLRIFAVLKNMAVPIDRWADLLGKANGGWDTAVNEAFYIWADERQRLVLEEDGLLIKHHGVIAEHVTQHSLQNNAIFLPTVPPKGLNPRFLFSLSGLVNDNKPELYNLEANLSRFEKVYSKALSEPLTLESMMSDPNDTRLKFLQSKDNQVSFKAVIEKFKTALQNQLDQLHADVEKLHEN